MGDFVDDKAEREEEEEEEEEKGDQEESEDVDSSEEDEGPDEYEEDGFIVGDDEEEGEGGSEEEGAKAAEEKKKKKKKRRRELVLEDEDYELLEENTGIRRARPTQHRRIKKARDMGGQQHDNKETFMAELFGVEEEGLEDDIEDLPPSKAARGGERGARGDGGRANSMERGGGRGREYDDEVEEDDWLVEDDEVEGGPPGQRRRRRRAIMQSLPGVDADAMEEAQDIFGDVGDLLALYESRKREVASGLAADDYEGVDEAELSDEEAAEELRQQREERRRQAAERRMREQLDPEAMARHFLLPSDEKIRDTDLPEREQLHRGADPAAASDLAACAQWVWERLVGEQSVRSVARDTLEDGAQEVEVTGPPPKWYLSSRWHHRDLKYDPGELHGQRAFFLGRDKEGRKAWRHSAEVQELLRETIRSVLEEIYDKHGEVPFIAMYRKEKCGELLATRDSDEPGCTDRDEANYPRGSIQAKHRVIRRWDIMWAVQVLAGRWRELMRRREARRRAYQRAAEAAAEAAAAGEGGEGAELAAAALQRCVELVQDAQDTQALDDVEAKFQLITAAGSSAEEAIASLSVADEEGGEGAGAGAAAGARRRRPQKASAYAACRRAGLGPAVRGLGLTLEQFAENVEATYKRHETRDPAVSPEDYAVQFVSDVGGFSDVEAVLRGIVLMAAAEIAAEPAVRASVRENFWDTATLSTAPTPAGEAALDPFHPLGCAKRLVNKPLRNFEGSDQFLRVLQAEKEGLVRVTLGVQSNEELLSPLAELYLSGGAAVLSQAWDDLRRRILQESLTQYLLPSLEREARSRLAAQAREVVVQEASDKLWAYASQAPLQVRLVDEDDFVPDRRVMAVVYGPGKPMTTFVMLDPAGNLVDFLHCPLFSGHIARQRARIGEVYDMFSDPKKSQDAARIRSFIEDHKPHVVVLGASHPEAKTLEADLKAIRDQILLDNPSFIIDLGTGDVATQMADESIAALWGASAAAAEELPTSPDVVRRAVALGRQMLDPLALLASLCGPGHEVLALQLHPLQGALSEEERLSMVDRVLSSVVAQVGVDLNAVTATPWTQAPLQFVPGLGPRKAAALLRAVNRSGGYVESRNQVWRELGVMGNRVFRNCGAYLRIRPAVKGMANLEMDPLDDTRVHPESYKHAIAIAQSAVAGGGDEAGEVAVENALARPQDVESLDLEAYSSYLAQEGQGNKLATLIDIQQEFVRPYGELRRELVALTDEAVFWLCSGETPETLKPGRKVEARVRYVGEDEVRCSLPDINDLEAVIRADYVSSKDSRVDCRQFFQNGATVTARVRNVEPQRSLIELTTRSSDLNDEAYWEHEYLYREDEHYHVLSAEDQRRMDQERRRQQNKRNYVPRPIRHPLFKNISLQDAASELLAKDNPEVGEGIFRPHPKGSHMLALTLLLPDKVVQHIDIKEGAKGSSGGGASHLALGSPLSVEIVYGKKTERYDDLDELTARYLEPVQSYLAKLVQHRKFRQGQGNWDSLQDVLREEKKRMPDARMAAYLLSTDDSKPGMFYLGFIVSTNPHREYFTVTPDGYHFRQKDFSSVDHMIAEWKKRPYGAKQQQAAAQARQAQMPQQAQQAYAPPQQQYAGGYGQQQQYGYPQGEYGGYTGTQYQEQGEWRGGGGGGAGQWNGGAPAAGGYGQYDAGGAPPPPPQQQQQGYDAYAAQQQYGQHYGGGGQQQAPPPPPMQQYPGYPPPPYERAR